jgi:hypothetical protein
VPVIATAHGFARELVRDWVSGFIVPFGDEDLLARRMEHFARQPYLRNALGYLGRRAALQSLDSWRFIDTHCRIYDCAGAREIPDLETYKATLPTDTTFFDRRVLAPTYPLRNRTPDDQRVLELITAHSGVENSCQLDIRKVERGSSLQWRVTGDGQHWLIKHPYSRIEVRPLWDPSRPRPLVQSTEQRFAQELFSSTLPGFAEFAAVSASEALLARQDLPQISGAVPVEEMCELVATLDRLHRADTAELSSLQSLICHDWRTADRGAVVSAMADLAAWIGRGEIPWHAGHHFGLSLSWRILRLDVSEKRLMLPPQWSTEDDLLLAFLADLADGGLGPVVICHGSPHVRHFVRMRNKSWALIDGERLHPSEAEEDLAYLAFHRAEYDLTHTGTTAAIARSIDSIVDDDVRRLRLLSWCGLHAVEGLCRQTYFGRRQSLEKYESLWRSVQRAAAPHQK